MVRPLPPRRLVTLHGAPRHWILCGIFAIVSSILLRLLVISRGWMEKFYFAFCTISAGSGLLRTAAGDQTFHAGLYIR